MYQVRWFYRPALLLFDIIGNILFFWKKLKRFPKQIRKVLVIRLDHVGDAVMSTPVFSSLKMNYPSAEVHVLCRSLTREVFAGNPNVSKVIEFNPFWFSRKDFDGWLGFFRTISALRKEKYDLVLEFHADPRNILLADLIGGYKVGYGIRGFGFLLNRTARYEKRAKHNIERNLDILKAIGVYRLSAEPEFFVSKQDAQKMAGILGSKKYVCINPGTGRQEKYWINERWAELCDRLSGLGYRILFTGSSSDHPAVDEVMRNMKTKNYLNIVGRTSLGELAAAVKRCRLFIGPDTGPMHIARAVKTPLIGLFSPVDPAVWGYCENNYRNIRKEQMSGITVSEVMDLAKKMLRGA